MAWIKSPFHPRSMIPILTDRLARRYKQTSAAGSAATAFKKFRRPISLTFAGLHLRFPLFDSARVFSCCRSYSRMKTAYASTGVVSRWAPPLGEPLPDIISRPQIMPELIVNKAAKARNSIKFLLTIM